MRAHFARLRVNAALRAAVVAIGVSTTAVPIAAQQAPAEAPARRDTSSLPFRDDQWGMDFGISPGRVYRIGVVRFTSPTRAWILDGRINGSIDRSEYETDFPDSLPFLTRDAISQGGSVSLLVGRRAYRALGTRAMRTMSFGVGGGFGYDEWLAGGRRERHSMSSNATAEFAIGAHYRLTPSLALGGTTRLAATYRWEEHTQDLVRQRLQRVDAGFGASELVLSLFF